MTAAADDRSLVRVELDPALARCLAGTSLAETLTERLGLLTADLGLPAPTGVEVAVGDAGWAVRILVQGCAVPCSLALLRRTWLAVAPPELSSLAVTDFEPSHDLPDAWLTRLAARLADAPATDAGIAVVASYVVELVVGALALHPAPLLTPAAAVAYLQQDTLDPAEAHSVLTAVLELGVSLRRRDLVAPIVTGRSAVGGSVGDCVEEAFSRLRRPALEVFVHPEFLGRDGPLASASAPVSIKDERLPADLRSFGAAAARHLVELGVSRPILLSPDSSLRRDLVRVRINDRTGPPIPLARADEVAVQFSPSLLAAGGVTGRVLIDAASGNRLVAVPATEARRVGELNLTPLTPGAFMAVAVAREVSCLADRLLAIDDVEQDLADLERTHPDLVHEALRLYSYAKITRVLRGLLREQISTRDLWAILNAILRYEAVGLPEPGLRLFDPRLPVEDPDLPLSEVPVENLVEFARLQMCSRLAYESGLRRAGSADAAPQVYSLESAAGRWLRQLIDHGGPSDADADIIRRSIGRLLAQEGAPADAVILTPPAIRVALHHVLTGEFPSVRVLATTEVPTGTEVRVQRGIEFAVS